MNKDTHLIFESYFNNKPENKYPDLSKAEPVTNTQVPKEVPAKEEDAESKVHPNTIKAQQLLDQATQLIIKATNLPKVQWNYYDENNPDVDLQNALENIKDYVKQHIGF